MGIPKIARLCLSTVLFVLLFLTSHSAGASAIHADSDGADGETIDVISGIASFVAHRFHGRPTASGETFDMNALTAAHRDLPFGTMLRVTNVRNGNSVVVRVNDRGPFVKNRIIDLSYGAAQKLGFVRRGLTNVDIEILETP